MHETALVKELVREIEAVARSRGHCKVVRATVRLGQLAPYSPGALREQFRHAAVGTLAEGAELVAEPATDPCYALGYGVLLVSVDLLPVTPSMEQYLPQPEEPVAAYTQGANRNGALPIKGSA